MVMLELEAMGLDRVRTELSAQYVDHNLLQTDFRNADDHLFLRSACQRFGLWYSKPGNGVSHPVHMQRFGVPGKTLLGSDSHTCAAGSLGMLAIGAGGLEVAMAMAGEPFHLTMPEIWGPCPSSWRCPLSPSPSSRPVLTRAPTRKSEPDAGTCFNGRKRPSTHCPFDTAAARAYGRVYSVVAGAGQTARGRRAVDLLIAATALAISLPLYTRNVADFEALAGTIEVVHVELES